MQKDGPPMLTPRFDSAKPAIRAPGVRWLTAEACDAALAGETVPNWFALADETPPNWFALADDPRAELVKRNPVREVYRVKLSNGVVFAKIFDHTSVVATIKRWIIGPPAMLEFRAAQQLARAGVGAIRVLAAGVAVSGDQSVLVSEEFHGARTLADLWEHRSPAAAPLVTRTAAFVAGAHSADILAKDMHPKNLLVRPGASPGEWDIAYADLAGIRVGRPVTLCQAAGNIAEVYQWFRDRTTTTQRARFLRAYVGARFGENRGLKKRFARQVEAAVAAHQRRLWAKRDRRVLGTNAYFARTCVSGDWTAHLALRCRGDAGRPGPSEGERSPDQWRQWLRRHLPDLGITPAPDLPDDLYLDREHADSWRALWWRLAGSPLHRAFVVAHALRHRDLPALSAPALFERRPTGSPSESVLMIQRPAACASLRDTVQRLLVERTRRSGAFGGSAGQRALGDVLGVLGRLLADVVQRGVTARCLTLDAFATAPGADADRPVIYISDFHGWIVRRRPRFAAVIWLPACLLRSCPRGVTRTDYLRFLRAYFPRLPREHRHGGWKALWKRIETVANG